MGSTLDVSDRRNFASDRSQRFPGGSVRPGRFRISLEADGQRLAMGGIAVDPEGGALEEAGGEEIRHAVAVGIRHDEASLIGVGFESRDGREPPGC